MAGWAVDGTVLELASETDTWPACRPIPTSARITDRCSIRAEALGPAAIFTITLLLCGCRDSHPEAVYHQIDYSVSAINLQNIAAATAQYLRNDDIANLEGSSSLRNWRDDVVPLIKSPYPPDDHHGKPSSLFFSPARGLAPSAGQTSIFLIEVSGANAKLVQPPELHDRRPGRQFLVVDSALLQENWIPGAGNPSKYAPDDKRLFDLVLRDQDAIIADMHGNIWGPYPYTRKLEKD